MRFVALNSGNTLGNSAAAVVVVLLLLLVKFYIVSTRDMQIEFNLPCELGKSQPRKCTTPSNPLALSSLLVISSNACFDLTQEKISGIET